MPECVEGVEGIKGVLNHSARRRGRPDRAVSSPLKAYLERILKMRASGRNYGEISAFLARCGVRAEPQAINRFVLRSAARPKPAETEDAKWDRIFRDFIDPTYYSPRLPGFGSSFVGFAAQMEMLLAVRYEVVYYDAGGRFIYWPADERSDVLAAKLRECRDAGHANAHLSEASRP